MGKLSRLASADAVRGLPQMTQSVSWPSALSSTCSSLHAGPWLHLACIRLCILPHLQLPHPTVQYPFSFLPPSSCCALTSLTQSARSSASGDSKFIHTILMLISQPSLYLTIKQAGKDQCQVSDPLFSSVLTPNLNKDHNVHIGGLGRELCRLPVLTEAPASLYLCIFTVSCYF